MYWALWDPVRQTEESANPLLRPPPKLVKRKVLAEIVYCSFRTIYACLVIARGTPDRPPKQLMKTPEVLSLCTLCERSCTQHYGAGLAPKRESLEEQEQSLWPSRALKARRVCNLMWVKKWQARACEFESSARPASGPPIHLLKCSLTSSFQS